MCGEPCCITACCPPRSKVSPFGFTVILRLPVPPTCSGYVRAAGGALVLPSSPTLNVNATHGETDFIVDGVSGFDAETLIDGHVDRARKDDCSGIVWAELTMPEAHVALLQESLARHALDDGTAPDFIVAGSCHRDMEGSMRNVSRILDGSGSTIFELVKWAKFLLDGHFEAIEPGTEIPVLITGGEIVVMAICRDFLDEADEEPPYCQLDVDLAIVPSMANLAPTTTMDGHIATARTMSIRFGTQTMVVQQPPSPDPTGRSGQVMLYPKRPIANAQPITVETPWMFCQLETL